MNLGPAPPPEQGDEDEFHEAQGHPAGRIEDDHGLSDGVAPQIGAQSDDYGVYEAAALLVGAKVRPRYEKSDAAIVRKIESQERTTRKAAKRRMDISWKEMNAHEKS